MKVIPKFHTDCANTPFVKVVLDRTEEDIQALDKGRIYEHFNMEGHNLLYSDVDGIVKFGIYSHTDNAGTEMFQTTCDETLQVKQDGEIRTISYNRYSSSRPDVINFAYNLDINEDSYVSLCRAYVLPNRRKGLIEVGYCSEALLKKAANDSPCFILKCRDKVGRIQFLPSLDAERLKFSDDPDCWKTKEAESEYTLLETL